MSRNTLSKKDPGKSGRPSASSANRGIVLALAGFTALAIVAIAVVAILSTTGGGNAESFTPNDQGLLEVGTQAPDFTTETVDGSGVSLGGGDYDATMLVFFASWCPHCQNEAPIISEMESEYEDLRILMIGIDNTQGDNPQKVREFVDEYDISSPAIYEPSLGVEYQVSGYPTVYFIDSSGEIVAANSGEAPRGVYEDWAEEALNS
ncbi:MAG TPA: TlpA disulfide reductase family protein [Rubrobacteraceae bacterium]|nr:TlpA disulfide reductase family protein [Rubrobacteraceae bacterium]